jgi:hypothetical protein
VRVEFGEWSSMAIGRSVVVMALAMLAVVVVTQVEAGYGSSDSAAKFASGLDSAYYEDAADQFLDEPTRRILATQTYISYGALNGNRAPCPSSSAGRSYYTAGCANTGAVSPYERSCDQITRCARG